MSRGTEQSFPGSAGDDARKTQPDLKLVPPLLEDGDLPDEPDLNPEALARAKATPESLIDSPYLRAARNQLVSAWADVRKYEHGLTGAVRGIVARKSKETVQARYDAASHAYQQALREQAQEVEREFGVIEKAKALVSAMEELTDERAERVLADMKNENSHKLYQLWQKMGELNVGNIEAVKNILAQQEDDGVWKGKAKMVGRFIARGMSLRSAVGAAMVGSGFVAAYAGWRMASGAASGVGTYTLMREGMSAGSRELLAGSESKVRREYGEAELASMDDKDLGELMQAYGARLGFHGEKLSGNTRFERVKNAFLSRLELVHENVEERIDTGWSEEPRTPEAKEKLEAMLEKKDAMLERLEGLSKKVEEELATKEKEDRRQRLIAAASALAVSGAIMYWRGGAVPEASTPPPAEVAHAATAEASSVAAEAAPSPAELPHGVAGVYEIKSGQGLLHAANEFQKAQHDEIVAGIKTQHPEWFAKGEDSALHRWRMEQVRDHGGSIGPDGEKLTEILHAGAKIQLEFDEHGYPQITTVEDTKLVSQYEQAQFRPRVDVAPASKPDYGFEKWTDDRPIRFSEPGTHGEIVAHQIDGSGELGVEIRGGYADDRPILRFLDPEYKESLSKHFGLERDEAAMDMLEQEARKAVKEYALREAALAHLNEQSMGNSGIADVLRRDMYNIVDSANKKFGDAQVFRSVSLPPEEAGAAGGAPSAGSADADFRELENIAEGKTAASHSIVELLKRQAELDPATVNPADLKFPTDWTSSQVEAARRVVTYHQEIVRAFEKQFGVYESEHAGDPLLEKLREKLGIAKTEALTYGEYSVHDMLKRMFENNPGNIPTVTFASGTSTIEGSARAEAGSVFNEWLKAEK